MTLHRASKNKESWSKIAQLIAKKTRREQAGDTLLERSSWDHRRKVELQSVLDLSSTLNEKYGDSLAFKLSLRTGKKLSHIMYKNPVSSKMTDPELAAIIIDDRSKKIEMIREQNGASPRRSYHTQISTSKKLPQLRSHTTGLISARDRNDNDISTSP